MSTPARDDRGPPRQYAAAHVEVHCPATTTHARSLILEHATIYLDGWARWAEDSHVSVGYVQAGRCRDIREVSLL
jgi:hypothetical protein